MSFTPTVPDIAALTAEIVAEFPSYQRRPKSDSWLMKLLGFFLPAGFMVSYMTTVRYTMYTPSNWDTWSAGTACALLQHERVHMRQSRSLTYPLYAFLYLCVLPVGLAFFRTYFEKRAYAAQAAAWQQYGMTYADDQSKSFVSSQFTTSAYGWMWPFPKAIGKWYDSVVAQLNA